MLYLCGQIRYREIPRTASDLRSELVGIEIDPVVLEFRIDALAGMADGDYTGRDVRLVGAASEYGVVFVDGAVVGAFEPYCNACLEGPPFLEVMEADQTGKGLLSS